MWRHETVGGPRFMGPWVALGSWVVVGGYGFCSQWVMGLMGMGFMVDFMCLDLGF